MSDFLCLSVALAICYSLSFSPSPSLSLTHLQSLKYPFPHHKKDACCNLTSLQSPVMTDLHSATAIIAIVALFVFPPVPHQLHFSLSLLQNHLVPWFEETAASTSTNTWGSNFALKLKSNTVTIAIGYCDRDGGHYYLWGGNKYTSTNTKQQTTPNDMKQKDWLIVEREKERVEEQIEHSSNIHLTYSHQWKSSIIALSCRMHCALESKCFKG